MFSNSIMHIIPYLYNQFEPSDIILIEPDMRAWSNIISHSKATMHCVHAIEDMRRYKPQSLGGSYREYTAMLWHCDCEVNYYKLSNNLLSGTVPVDTFKKLWRNISIQDKSTVQAKNIASFLKENTSVGDKFIIINNFNGLEIIKNIDFSCVSVVAIRVLVDSQNYLGKVALDDFMQSKGFKLLEFYTDNNLSTGMAVYIRDMQREITEFSSQLDISQKALVALQKSLELLKAESAAKEKQFDNVIAKLTVDNAQKSKELKTKSEQLSVKTREFEAANASARKKLSESSLGNDILKDIVKSLQVVENDIKKSSLNTIKQIESFIGIENYLSNDIKPLNFHGWPISTDLGLFLIEKIENHDYDLIIEVGSGTSTLLFARILNKKNDNLSINKKIMTFEHNDFYYEKTKKILENESLGNLVNLIYAPLVDYGFDDEIYNYYDCDIHFENIKNKEKIKRILVLVDGPPSATCPNARFPVLPYLLKHFQKSEINLVLDDADRMEEKNTIFKWEKLLDDRKIDYISENILSEKGLYFCSINNKCRTYK